MKTIYTLREVACLLLFLGGLNENYRQGVLHPRSLRRDGAIAPPEVSESVRLWTLSVRFWTLWAMAILLSDSKIRRRAEKFMALKMLYKQQETL